MTTEEIIKDFNLEDRLYEKNEIIEMIKKSLLTQKSDNELRLLKKASYNEGYTRGMEDIVTSMDKILSNYKNGNMSYSDMRGNNYTQNIYHANDTITQKIVVSRY